MSNNAILKRLRAHAFHRQQGLCFYCDQPMWLADPTTHANIYALSVRQVKLLQATAEHLKARCDGGKNSPRNIVAACGFCNQKRHARPVALEPSRYRILVQRRIAQHRWNYMECVAASRKHQAFCVGTTGWTF